MHYTPHNISHISTYTPTHPAHPALQAEGFGFVFPTNLRPLGHNAGSELEALFESSAGQQSAIKAVPHVSAYCPLQRACPCSMGKCEIQKGAADAASVAKRVGGTRLLRGLYAADDDKKGGGGGDKAAAERAVVEMVMRQCDINGDKRIDFDEV